MVKQKWFQPMEKNNLLSVQSIFNTLITILIIVGVIFAIHNSMYNDNGIDRQLKIADSLRGEVYKYNRQYDSLLLITHKLDSAIKDRKERIVIIRDSFVIYRNPPINNSDSALRYIKDFIRN